VYKHIYIYVRLEALCHLAEVPVTFKTEYFMVSFAGIQMETQIEIEGH
jgi:hypothetical protein